jgi:hypothetical protein
MKTQKGGFLQACTIYGKPHCNVKLLSELTEENSQFLIRICTGHITTAIGGLVVSVLATGPTGYSVVASNPTEDGGFLSVIKIPSMHFLQRGSKAVGPMS